MLLLWPSKCLRGTSGNSMNDVLVGQAILEPRLDNAEKAKYASVVKTKSTNLSSDLFEYGIQLNEHDVITKGEPFILLQATPKKLFGYLTVGTSFLDREPTSTKFL